jgi:phosphoglucosamine mutase
MHSTNLFGTDGIRGVANIYPMTADVVMRFGAAAGSLLRQGSYDSIRPRAIIAKDTRLSGYMFESAIMAGLISAGVDVVLVGPMPTPAVPMLVKSLRADMGIMITASHNPYQDNGLKLFDNHGYKLSEAQESHIQEIVLNPDKISEILAAPDSLGKAMRLEDAPGRYIEYVKNSFPRNLSLSGLRIVLDCANGAAYKIAPTILWELGAELITLGCEPNGVNINCNFGSIHPKSMCEKVVETRADLGIALDGDADRVVFCDEAGNLVHGDHVLGLIAASLQENNKLRDNAAVITNISNGKLMNFLENKGITSWQTKVGDRHVTSEMRKRSCNFGGEQSGHLIFSDYSSSGDGILAALQVLAVLKQSGDKASSIFNIFDLNPQIMQNIAYGVRNPLENSEINEKISFVQQKNSHLRIVIRKSGTEKVIRVMVEGAEFPEIQAVMDELLHIIGG